MPRAMAASGMRVAKCFVRRPCFAKIVLTARSRGGPICFLRGSLSPAAMIPPEEQLTSEAATDSLRAIYAQARDAIGVSNHQGVIVMANPAMQRLFGYEAESDMLGRTVLDMMAPAAREIIATMLRRRALDEPLPGVYRARGLRRDQSEMPIEVRTAPFLIGSEQNVLSVIRELPDDQQPTVPGDLSDDGFYKALFNVNTAVKILLEPTTGRIVDANRAAEEFYGWSRSELLSRRITDINQLTPEEVRQEMDNARTGRRRYFRFRHLIADGSIRHVEVYSGPVDLGADQFLLSIIHDVTERDALEEQLRESQRLELVGRLAGGVAHDFNNLLTVMMASAELLGAGTERGSPLRPYIDDIAHAAQRAADLTRDLLAFSRRQFLERHPLRIGEILPGVTAMLRRTLGAKFVLNCVVADDLPVVRADAGQLEQVIVNLAINARDAMPDGGTLTVRASAVKISEAEARVVPAGRWVLLEVEDEGAGMDEQTRLRVFEPFFTTKHGIGSGLGLSTVHGIISQSEGHVLVTSTPGEGTCFRIYLPEAQDVGESRPAPVRKAVVAERTPEFGRVLLAEDMAAVRRALASGLERAGLAVTQCASGQEVLELLQQSPNAFDVVVSDVIMPGMSGVDLAWELARVAPDLPVLLISGELRGKHRASFPAGVRFVAKPFTAERLAREIRLLIGGSSQPR